ncbi:MAG: HYR domain-containing protein, partial [Candidatus Bipolaricaulota bacterium]|nr:HYR domain-containing protein [Candidatus Bipolaricaulota bacterium]MDW8152577.1 HYR domain-containing protein [Candidatus Bipolaricaulota bacterium]
MIERTWTVTDLCGHTANGVQRIRYTEDRTPPTVHCPGNQTVYVRGCPPPSQAWVDFLLTATDTCDPMPALDYSPRGGYFPVGATTPVAVAYAAADACGNRVSGTCHFAV